MATLTRPMMPKILSQPVWAHNNPWLRALEPRFFTTGKSPNWSELPARIGRLCLLAEDPYAGRSAAEEFRWAVEEMIHAGLFFPNSPAMMNTEDEQPANLFACHALHCPGSDVDFSLAQSIFDGLGGVGFDLNEAKDPISIVQRLENETLLANTRRKRTGLSSATLRITHPAIVPFIRLSGTVITINLNVQCSRRFMEAVNAGSKLEVALWKVLCESIHRTGQPGLVFEDTKHRLETSPHGTNSLILNVCGEQPLRADESAIVGSLVLPRFIVTNDSERCLDTDLLAHCTRLAVRCLDDLHDTQVHANANMARKTLAGRKIGLGVMGYADALHLARIRYGSPESLDFAKNVMETIKRVALDESERLGRERGTCAPSLQSPLNQDTPRRNAALLAIAGTGSLSLLANVSGGIEPVFAALLTRKIRGHKVRQLDPVLESILLEQGADIGTATNYLQMGGNVRNIPDIPPDAIDFFKTAGEIPALQHIAVQGVFQKFLDGGVSKTVNLPATTSEEEIGHYVRIAWKEGCLGITLYRDGSRDGQPLISSS
jgi:ribonucleoside-diphosphate reductase alpha chain